MNTLEKLEILRNRQIGEYQKTIPRLPHIEYYQNCVLRDDLNFYYKHHKPGKRKIIYQEEVI